MLAHSLFDDIRVSGRQHSGFHILLKRKDFFAGQLPPIVSSPTFAIRKKAIKIFTLEQYVEAGVLTPRHSDVIKEAVRNHRNILVIGGTGSGKTTLINAIINVMVRSVSITTIQLQLI